MGVRSLTQAEAEERAALIAVDGYDIAVDLTDLPTGTRVRAVSTIAFTARTPGGSTFVDAAAPVVRATLNGDPLGPAVDGRLHLPDLREHNTLTVETDQPNTIEGSGVHRAVDPSDGEVYLWTSFEPDEARFVWACFDQPDLKAPHTFTVTAPEGWTVTSNSGAATVTGTTWAFPATPPLSPYNTVVNAGPFHRIRRTAGGYDLGLYCRRSLAAALDRDADRIFTLTAQGLAFFGDQFGMPFPQARYDQVFVPEFGGAMENFGCVTWSDSFVRRQPPTPAEQERLARVLLHEMAHMWFGNIVTMRWWDDLWLNEAFAEFACRWSAAQATEHTDAWADHLADGKLSAYLTDQGPTTHPIHQRVDDVAQAASMFDNITYPKGASVLRQLQIYVGEQAFRTGMAAYFARHAWGNTTLQDLIDELAAASGRDLTGWRDGWLSTAGTDRLTLEIDGEALTLVGRGPAGPPRPQVLAVGAYQRQDHSLVRTKRAVVEIQGERTPVDLPAGADLYLVNDDDLTFATTRPAVGELAALLPTPLARGVAVAGIWDALLTGEATAAATAEALVRVLRVETAPAVIEPYLTRAGDVAEHWTPPAQRPAVYAAVAAMCSELATRPERRRIALRALARVTTDPDALLALASDDAELGWRALVRKSELGLDTAADADALLARDPDPDAKHRLVQVRAAAPDPDAKAEAWHVLTAGATVPVSFIREVAAAFWRPGQEALLAPYADRYLPLLPTLHGRGMILASNLTRNLFPVHAADDSFFERAQRAAEDAAPVVRKTLTERSDEVARMLRTRSMPG